MTARLIPSLPITAPAVPKDIDAQITGSDLMFRDYLSLNAAGDYQTVSGDDLVRQEVWVCMVVAPGEWKLHPAFGVGIGRMLGETITEALIAEYKQRALEQLAVLPLVDKVLGVDFEEIDSPVGGLRVTVRVQSKGRDVLYRDTFSTDVQEATS